MVNSSEVTPKMENSLSDLPEWINAELFEMVLKERESDKSLKVPWFHPIVCLDFS